MGQFQYWKTETVKTLNWYWDAITADPHQRQTIIAHIRTNQESSTRSLLSTIGMRALRKGRNAALKLFAILNLSEPVSHAT